MTLAEHCLIAGLGALGGLGDPRLRIVYSIMIGADRTRVADDVWKTFVEGLDDAFTRLVGGVTRVDAVGGWTPGSEDGDYSGPLERDLVAAYTLFLMPDEEAILVERIRAAVCDAVRRHDLPIQHVHAARSLSEERIFQIDEAR
ncbi:MAG: hypothetical protein AAFZ06_15330 [Pseudomonadota bacterium]